MRWHRSDRADPRALPLANRHYNRQNPDSDQFVPPGRCLVLLTAQAEALWVTSWPEAAYVKHGWAGAWINSLFRNERRDLFLSSELILEAIAATRANFGEPPDLGMVTFVDAGAVKRKRDPGRCYRKAGFHEVGRTKTRNYVVLQLLPKDMPAPEPAFGHELTLEVG